MKQNKATEAEIEEVQRQWSEERDREVAANRLKTFDGMSKNLLALGGKYGKIGFRMQQAMALRETYINTKAAAISAYKSMVGIPYVGPVLAVAAAAAATAFGIQQAKEILSQSYGGGGGGGGASAPAVGGGAGGGALGASMPSAPAQGVNDANQAANQPTTVHVTVHNPLGTENWDRLAEEQIVPAINRAGSRAVKIEGQAVGEAA